MNSCHARSHIRLTSQAEVMDFIQRLCRCEDVFSIENRAGTRCINAKSVIGVMYTVLDYPDEMYLVNETKDGAIPAFVDQYRVMTA